MTCESSVYSSLINLDERLSFLMNVTSLIQQYFAGTG
jgi:hypothetical protein